MQWPYAATWQWFGGPVVGCFFLLSGFGLAASFKAKGNAYIRSFPKKRLSRMLPPFLILTTTAIIIKAIYIHIPFHEQLTALVHGETPLDTSWFVYALLLFYFLFYIFASATHSVKQTGYLLIASTIIYMITLYALHFGGYWYSAIPALPIGYFISIHETRINQLLSLHRATIIVTTIIAIWIVAYFSISHRQALQPAINIIIPLAVYILIKCLPNQHHVKIIDQIGSMSYEIYLCQGLFCIFLQHSPLPISLLLMTLGTILLATILYRCLSPHPKQQSSNS